MRVDPEVNSLLWRWGRSRVSEDLGYPKECVYLKDYQPPYPNPPKHLGPDPSFIGDLIDKHLSRPMIECLKCKYRYKLKKFKSARRMGLTKHEYDVLFAYSVKTIEGIYFKKISEIA